MLTNKSQYQAPPPSCAHRGRQINEEFAPTMWSALRACTPPSLCRLLVAQKQGDGEENSQVPQSSALRYPSATYLFILSHSSMQRASSGGRHLARGSSSSSSLADPLGPGLGYLKGQLFDRLHGKMGLFRKIGRHFDEW